MQTSLSVTAPNVRASGDGPALLAITALFRHRRVFLYVLCITFGMAVALAVLTKRQYRSEMKYLVQNARSTLLISPDHTSTSVVNVVTEEELNSELSILQSEDVLSAVADPGWSPDDAMHRSKKDLRTHSKKLSSLSSHLTVDPIGKEDIMSVSFLADTPQEATQVLSALSKAYLARHEQLRRPIGTSTFFEEQARHYEDQWNMAVRRLVEFQQANHLVSVPDVEESIQRSLLADQEAFRNNELKLRESDAGIRQANDLMSSLPQRQQTQQRVVPSEQLLEQLKVSVVGLQNRRTELLNRYKPEDRLVTEVDQQIADTQRAINDQSARQNVENTSDVNPAWQQLKTSLIEEQVQRGALLGARSEIQRNVDDLKSQLSHSQDLELAFDQLRSQAEEAQSNYKAFTDKRDLARVEDAMDESKLLNVVLMENPTFSQSPSRPKPMLDIVLGIPTALLLATAAVYFAEMGRKSIAESWELGVISEHQVLASIAFDPAFGEGPASQLTANGLT
jgi:polysaccharide biosynthesis protein PslE